MQPYNTLVLETAKLCELIDRYKGRYITSEQTAIRKQADKVMRLIADDYSKLIQIKQSTLWK